MTSAPSSPPGAPRDGRLPVRFENTRFDPDGTPFHDLAKQMAAHFGYRAELALDPRLAELLRLRVAQLNPCSYCLILHTRVATELGIPPEVPASFQPSRAVTTLLVIVAVALVGSALSLRRVAKIDPASAIGGTA